MKKVLLFFTVLALINVASFAQITARHGSGTNHLWLCHDQGAPKTQCKPGTPLINSMKCCWKSDPLASGGKGDNGSKAGVEPHPYFCGDPGAPTKVCEGPWQNTTTLDRKCCWKHASKGNNKGGKKVSPEKQNKVTTTTKPTPIRTSTKVVVTKKDNSAKK